MMLRQRSHSRDEHDGAYPRHRLLRDALGQYPFAYAAAAHRHHLPPVRLLPLRVLLVTVRQFSLVLAMRMQGG